MQAPLPFGKYLLDAELAQGGMSRVFDARLRGPGGFEKRLVVKQILPQLAQDPSFVELFVQEANTLVQMSHPNVVPVYELGVLDGVYFLAMERVHGATVAELLRDGALPQAHAALLGAQICEALRYAHERFGIVHRDVTPRNVMVDGDGHVRLLDFGIAAPSAQTGHGELFGSPGYMSPEQAARRPLTAASDMFAVGAVLYEALSARRASERGEHAPALAQSDAIDPELSALIARLLDCEPSTRPSAADSALALRTWLARNHPEGVQRQLGARAEQAVERRAQAPARASDSLPPSAASGTPRVTRSIAASKTLVELLAESTEALPGRASALSSNGAVSNDAVSNGALSNRTRPLLALGGAAALAALIGAAVLRNEPAPPVHAKTRGAGAAPAVTKVARDGAHAAALGSVQRATSGLAADPAGSPQQNTSTTAAAVATAARGAPEAPVAGAELSVNAMPWATVRLDGRALGSTPQRALPVRAGSHVLELDCPPLGRSARIPLKLAPGDHPRLVVDMQTDPPTVSVR
jgi:eukaryotic-like serine/threonine-protein kinase